MTWGATAEEAACRLPGDELLGCAYGGKKRYVLGYPASAGSSSGTGGSRLYTLGGPVVAFEDYAKIEALTGARFENVLLVRDLHSGKLLHEVPTGTPTTPATNGNVGIGKATAIVVKGDGTVAWIVGVAGLTPDYQVHALDSAGSRVLASGSDVAPTSLALVGDTLYWTQGGKANSASLN